MYGNRRFSAAAQRSQERRDRENQAPRLSAEVPRLANLKLEIEEFANGSPVPEPKHVKRVVVEHAPALFLLPCGDSRCDHGGHDVTHSIMRSLRSGEVEFDGEDHCHGSTGGAPCGRTLRYHAFAEYKPS
jgi:hypothetical protein